MSDTDKTAIPYGIIAICVTSIVLFALYLKFKVEYETVRYETIHPYNHCIQIIIAESKKQNTPADVNKAHNICFGLQSGGEGKQKP